MSNLISSFTEQDFYNETLILERIKEWEDRIIKFENKLKEAKKSKDKYTIKNTKSILKNARLEIKGYQRQTLTALGRIKEEYNNLVTKTNKQQIEDQIRPKIRVAEQLKEIGDRTHFKYIQDKIDTLENLRESDSRQQLKLAEIIGISLMELNDAFSGFSIAQRIDDIIITLATSNALEMREENEQEEIFTILSMLKNAFISSFIFSSDCFEDVKREIVYLNML